jgi:hypothetical protein
MVSGRRVFLSVCRAFGACLPPPEAQAAGCENTGQACAQFGGMLFAAAAVLLLLGLDIQAFSHLT